MAKKRKDMKSRVTEFFTVWRVLVLVYALIFSFILADAVSQFVSLPSPIYGGDYYFQMGCFYHIMEGGNLLDSSSMTGEVPGYMPVYPLVGSIYCAITGSAPMECMINFSVVIFFFSVIFWFVALSIVFKDERTAFFATIAATSILQHPVLKYTNFTRVLIFPLFLFLLYKTFEERKLKWFAALGIFYGLLPLTHIVFFVGATFIVGIFILNEIYQGLKEKDKKKMEDTVRNILVFAILALPLLMLYWYRPIFEWNLYRPYDRTHMDVLDVARGDVQIEFLAGSFADLLDFSGVQFGITILFLFGLYKLAKIRKEMGYLEKFLVLFSIASVLVTFSYFITEPLLEINFIPQYLRGFTLNNAAFLISIYGLHAFVTKNKLFSEKIRLGIIAAYLLLFMASNLNAFNENIENDRWMVIGTTKEMPAAYRSLQNYILENTDVNDVFLTTKELSFVINSLSGRKIMVNRWAQQNNPYTDMPQRDEDAAVIFYGNRVSEKLELLNRYNVSYFYWDTFWIESEYMFDDMGGLESIYDPLMTMDTEENRRYLEENGVKYEAMNSWIDPSVRRENVRKFDLLYIWPDNYQSFEHPWNPNLDSYLEKVWEHKENGITYAVLYRVRTS